MATKIRQVVGQAFPAPAYRVFQPSSNLPPPVILTAEGIQSPFDAPTRLWQRRCDRLAGRRFPCSGVQILSAVIESPPPSSHSHRSGNPEPYRCANLMRVCRNAPGRTLQVGRRPVHPARLGPMRRAYSSSLTSTPRHSHRSRNPEPYRCANAAMATKIRQVSGQAFPPRKYSAGRFNRSTGIA